MTKAERIYEDSKQKIKHDVRIGFNYDALGRMEYGCNESICMRTINAMLKLWEDDVRRFERDMRLASKFYREESELDRLKRECETLRRLGLTLKNAKAREIAWKSVLKGEMTIEEFDRVA